MNIRIDPHLEKFEVISQLKKLLIEYSKDKRDGKYEDATYSFSDYLYQRSLNPVRRFLMLCIPEDRFQERIENGELKGANYDVVIDYYTAKFQSLRGTLKIFEYLEDIKEILGIKKIDYKYTVIDLQVNFEEVETIDMNLFTTSAYEFFQFLLYFQNYIDAIQNLKLNLESELLTNLTGGAEFYNIYEITEVVNEN